MEQVVYDELVAYNQELREDLKVCEAGDGGKVHGRYMDTVEALMKLHAQDMDYYDKEERRKLEEKKIESNQEIESNKQKLGWKRVAFELTKTALPIAGSIFCITSGLFYARQMEEEGIIKTNFSRQVLNQIPKLWNGK